MFFALPWPTCRPAAPPEPPGQPWSQCSRTILFDGKSKKKKSKAKKQTVELDLRLNVEVSAGGRRPRRERTKWITSRKRQNLRELRRSLPRAGGAQAFATPGSSRIISFQKMSERIV